MKLKQHQIQAALGIALIGVDFNSGVQGYIHPESIPADKWTKLHGDTLTGIKVNSPSIALVPESSTVAIESEGSYFGMPAADFEVMVAGAAKKLGYDVKPTATLRAAST
jgi:hypothetical protein